MQKLDSQHKCYFIFNGITVRVTYTAKSSNIQSRGGGEDLLFLIDPLSPGSPHPQGALGEGGDRLSLSVMYQSN